MSDDLYLLGNKECLGMRTACVVGSRRMSKYGERVTKEFVRGLVEAGYCIVSGLAYGVDRVAHETAIGYKGSTLAVVAHGVDQCYPREHEGLKKRIVESGGLIVSEHPEGVRPRREYFRSRNRVMVRLSQIVLVTEAARKSGTKITTGVAGELGKTVYAVPGPVNLESYKGVVEIIRDGGVPVYSPADLLRMIELGI